MVSEKKTAEGGRGDFESAAENRKTEAGAGRWERRSIFKGKERSFYHRRRRKTTLLYEMAGCVKRSEGTGDNFDAFTVRRKNGMTRVWKRSKENFAQAAQRLSGSACRDPEKLSMPETELFEEARKKADLTLIEADGRAPASWAPAEHEPALLSSSNLVIGVTGRSALGQPLVRAAFGQNGRRNCLAVRWNISPEEDLARLIASEQGQQKDLKQNVLCGTAPV